MHPKKETLTLEKTSRDSHDSYDELATSEDGLLEGQKSNKHTSMLRFISSFSAAAFHTLILIIYSAIFIYSAFKLRSDNFHGAGIIYSPAREAIEFQSQVFDIDPNVPSTYFGNPSPELDKAWHDLLKHQTIRVSKTELERLDRVEGIELPGGGYLGSLMVYHNLHCLQRLHHNLYQEEYFPNITAQEALYDRIHNKHCLNTLLLAIKCQADISPLTMRWGKTQPAPIANFTAPHECVNWDLLEDWLEDRSIDAYAPGILIHPVLGPAFPDGENTQRGRIGVAVDNK